MATEAEESCDQTVYVQDILPQSIKDLLKEPTYDLDKILLHQIKVVSNCKKSLVLKRTELLAGIEKECNQNDYKTCGPFGDDFLNSVLKDVEEDEAEARRNVLGEQESVEMFKAALANEAVSEDHLAAAKAYRDAMTKQLAEVVQAREIALIALEILRRSPIASTPQQNSKMEALGMAYTEAKQTHMRECETLKKLTEWKKKPELRITEDDEFFSFFSENESSDEQEKEDQEKGQRKQTEVKEDSGLASALATCEAEQDKLVHFKSTKVDSVDNEFNMLSDLASDILKYETKIKDAILFIRQGCGQQSSPSPGSIGIDKYIIHLKTKYPKFKFKLSTKGYNFSLKVMRKTKSVVSLTLLTTLLDASQDLPDEILEAQEKFSHLSNAVKRICSKYGRCSMAFQSVFNREKELDAIVQKAPKVNYAESLRISGNFASNMKEVKRVCELKDEMKRTADRILKEVLQATGENVAK